MMELRVKPVWQELKEIWRTLASGQNTTPSIRDLSIDRLGPILTHCWRLKKVNDAQYLIELMGDSVAQKWGLELTGSNFFDLVRPRERPLLNAFYTEVLNQPCGMRFGRISEKAGTGNFFKVTTAGFPFADSDGETNLIVGSFEMEKLVHKRVAEGSLSFDDAQITDCNFIDLGHGKPSEKTRQDIMKLARQTPGKA